MNALLWMEQKLYKELIETLNSKPEAIVDDINRVYDPEAYGYLDSAEHVTGLGFVTLQTFLTAIYGILDVEKKKALSFGPKHTDGNSVAKIVNDAANYWKHNNEWVFDKSSKRKEFIEDTFKSVGFPIDAEYPLCGILTELSAPKDASFMAIFEKLELWQKNLEANA
jgi:hypothetical protein